MLWSHSRPQDSSILARVDIQVLSDFIIDYKHNTKLFQAPIFED